LTPATRRFLSVEDIREQWPFIGKGLQQPADHFELDAWFVETETLVPIAETYDGGIYCIDVRPSRRYGVFR